MPLSAGDKLGPYEIVSAIGAGGMGEVYKARDTRLDRTVAVKVLPEHIAQRDEMRVRFEREARSVASLNHPNICSLFDIGPGYMVMELIEGETLAGRIEKGAIPLDQALQVAVQIADALDRAHRAGVTHRDVKPQNIMLTRDGVKVLDFGLAKAVAKPGPTEATLTNVLTTEGTVMGTPQYMAPEQFEGREADARSDIWAFGAVLYEMVTGRKAFAGKSYSSLVGAILATDPAPMAVQPFTPVWLERMVRRCLAKDPEDRWQSMRDVVLELRTPPGENVTEAAKASRWPWALAAATLVLGALAGGWAVGRSRPAAAPEQAFRSQLNPPEGGQFDTNAGIALSPDGRTLAFVAAAPGKRGLWLLSIDGTAAQLLPGTELARRPFWSPDSRSIAYSAGTKIWRVDAAGGSPVAICDSIAFSGGAWTPEGVIVFAVGPTGLRRVPASGGTSEPLTTLDPGRGETVHHSPQLLPGGRILFSVSSEKPEQAGSYAISISNPKERVRVLATNSAAVYAAGHLLWRRDSTLIAQRFDPDRLQLSGEPMPIAERVGTSGAIAGVAVSAASSALLVHGRMGGDQLTWVDREGKSSDTDKSTLGEPGAYSSFRVSPDGRRVVVSRRSDTGTDLWMVDAERDAWSRFTFLPGTAWIPVWSPDGKQVMFRAGTPSTLYRKEASGAGTEQRITESANRQWPADWSRDGRLVLYHESTPETQVDLWVLPVTPDGQPSGKARPYLRSRFMEEGGRFSPEPSPRWVAYMSDESGRAEVYVQSFPEPRAKFQISTGGGEQPEWSPDGRELFYVSADGKLMAASLQLGTDSVTPSTPRELFALPRAGVSQAFKVGRDGKRFLVQKPVGGARPLDVIVNWPALLKKGAVGE